MAALTDNTVEKRYEMLVDGQTAFVSYRRTGGLITLIHTEVPPALGGRGIGSELARSVLEDIRGLGIKVVPECQFMANFIDRHPEFSDLVAR